ncbi:hypothetical protein [Aquimarina algiphila]|uniref:Uncharacterized protein n=1 Tax=Aquimarina algiphila TaxID=2047982 RepID=A0A554VAX9_9FLAO|nr:hypothetical protein [Aquimarina algiphila]TSE03474.1 hypothetical protein FOF46_29225 [Aquimarina algiphila]
MENKEKIEQEVQLEIIEKLPKQILQEMLDIYKKSAEMESYVKIPFLIIGVFFLIHNIFIAGRSYSYDTYNTIKTTEFSIVGIIVIVVFIMAGIAIDKNLKLKKKLTNASKTYNISLETMQNEFSGIAANLYGGRGVKLTK